jgi:hypothetical protein
MMTIAQHMVHEQHHFWMSAEAFGTRTVIGREAVKKSKPQKPLKTSLGFFGGFAGPCANELGTTIYVIHDSHLAAPLANNFLVDTQRIGPNWQDSIGAANVT